MTKPKENPQKGRATSGRCDRIMFIAGEEVHCNRGTKNHAPHTFHFVRVNGIVSDYVRI